MDNQRTWVSTFLQHLAENGNISHSARLTGITSTTVRAKRKADADFAAAMASAIEDSTDILEMEARRRAVHGVPKPVVYQGQLTPVWERDENGQIVTRAIDYIGPKGEALVRYESVQARDEHGQPKYLTVSEYSDSLLAMLLKGNRRSKYGDKQEITAVNGSPPMDETKRVSRLAALFNVAMGRKDIA